MSALNSALILNYELDSLATRRAAGAVSPLEVAQFINKSLISCIESVPERLDPMIRSAIDVLRFNSGQVRNLLTEPVAAAQLSQAERELDVHLKAHSKQSAEISADAFKFDFLKKEELAAGFAYPKEFLRVAQLTRLDLEPWTIMDGNVLRQVHDYAQDNIRDKRFVTFAQFSGDDSAACFDLDNSGSVVILDIIGEPFGFDHCKTYSDAYAWAKDAINLMVRYDL